MNIDLVKSLLISSSLGALIGLVRQWENQRESFDETNLAGVRTFTLWAALGTCAAHISQSFSPLFFPVSFALLGAVLLVTYFRDNGRHFGLTSYTAALLTFVVGGMVFWGEKQAAITLAVGMLIILASKEAIHGWTHRLTWNDIYSTLQFAAITGVILPLAPNVGYGPFQAFNPFSIWMMVVLISGLGFAGYVAMRMMGARAGIAVTGLVGGLASSTATMLAFSRKSREQPELSENCALANVLACTVMLGRVGALVLVLSPDLFQRIALPLAIMAVPGIIFSVWSYLSSTKRNSGEIETPSISNPLSLSMAIKFAALYAIIIFLVKAASASQQHGAGIYGISFISGLTDMDAITLSLAEMVQTGKLDISLCAKGVMLAAISNTLLKLGFAITLGSPLLRVRSLQAMGATLVFGGFGIAWLFAVSNLPVHP